MFYLSGPCLGSEVNSARKLGLESDNTRTCVLTSPLLGFGHNWISWQPSTEELHRNVGRGGTSTWLFCSHLSRVVPYNHESIPNFGIPSECRKSLTRLSLPSC